jgi:AraC-like DNA-binding protein
MDKDKLFAQEGYLKENYHYFHLRDTAGQELDFHFHDFDKIVLLISGSVNYVVEDKTYTLRPWNVLLVRHHAVHKALIDKSDPYDRIIIYIDRKYFDRVLPEASLMDCFDRADKSGQHLLIPDDEQRERLSVILEAFEREQSGTQRGAQALCDTYMMQLLIHISRIASAAPEQPDIPLDPKIARTLSYINENLTAELNVDTLAALVYLSRYHFMRLFKVQTGSTVNHYIRQKRLLYAARLIREGVSANKAAADSGFADYSTFHRAFVKSFGMSPGSLKR